jgi:DHA1 family inner membrane transport protein
MTLIVAAFVSMIDRSVTPPLVPVIAVDLGSSIEAVGHSLTLYAVAYAAFQLVWSTLSTRWGRIRVLAVSTAVSGVANVYAGRLTSCRSRLRVRACGTAACD